MVKFQQRKLQDINVNFGLFLDGTACMPSEHHHEGIQEDYAVTKYWTHQSGTVRPARVLFENWSNLKDDPLTLAPGSFLSVTNQAYFEQGIFLYKTTLETPFQ